MNSKTKVSINVEGLGKQDIYMPYKDAVEVFAAASMDASTKLLKELHGDKNSESEKVGQGNLLKDVSDNTIKVHERMGRHYIGEGAISKYGINRNVTTDESERIETRDVPEVLERASDAIRVYADDSLKRHAPAFIKDCMKNCDSEEVSVITGKELSDEEVEYYNQRSEVLNNNPFTHEMFTKPKLVAYKCPECGEVTVRWVTLSENNIVNCHFCRYENIVIETVSLTNTICPNCLGKTILYAANHITEMKCNKCESPIDLVYKNNNKVVSANMVR